MVRETVKKRRTCLIGWFNTERGIILDRNARKGVYAYRSIMPGSIMPMSIMPRSIMPRSNMPGSIMPRSIMPRSASSLNLYSSHIGLARTVYIYIRCIWPYIWQFPCQKYCIYIEGAIWPPKWGYFSNAFRVCVPPLATTRLGFKWLQSSWVSL